MSLPRFFISCSCKRRQVPRTCGPMISLVGHCAPGEHGRWSSLQPWSFGEFRPKWLLPSMWLSVFQKWYQSIVSICVQPRFQNDVTQVEKNWSCIKMHQDGFPDSCIFPDILDCVANPPKKANWTPSGLQLVNECNCAQHKRQRLDLWTEHMQNIKIRWK